MKNEKGFTITELLIALGLLIVIGAWGLGIYSLIHFIVKYW